MKRREKSKRGGKRQRLGRNAVHRPADEIAPSPSDAHPAVSDAALVAATLGEIVSEQERIDTALEHQPVLLQPTMDALVSVPPIQGSAWWDGSLPLPEVQTGGRVFVDATFGAGGHTRGILRM